MADLHTQGCGNGVGGLRGAEHVGRNHHSDIATGKQGDSRHVAHPRQNALERAQQDKLLADQFIHRHGDGPALRAHDLGQPVPSLSWAALGPSLWSYWQRVQAKVVPKHQAGRVKQWLHYLRRTHPQAGAAYLRLRTVHAPHEFGAALAAELGV